jgi:hypothetical protein
MVKWVQAMVAGLALSMMAPSSIYAVSKPLTDVQAKLIIIHNFIGQYVRWPGRYSLDETRQIYICSQGADELTRELPILEQASTSELKVHVVQNPRSEELTICHVMYFAASEKGHFQEQMQKIKGYPVLTISSMKHFLEKGGMVSLETEIERQGNFEQRFVRYSINSGALTRAKLVVEPDAIELANEVLP